MVLFANNGNLKKVFYHSVEVRDSLACAKRFGKLDTRCQFFFCTQDRLNEAVSELSSSRVTVRNCRRLSSETDCQWSIRLLV